MDATGNVSCDHEYVVAYEHDRAQFAGAPRDFARYRNPDGDPRGDWIADNLSASKPGGDTLYAITDPATGYEYWPPKGRYWPYNPATMATKIREDRVLFPGTRAGTPMLKRFRSEARRTHRPVSTWIGSPREATVDGEVVTLGSGHTTEGTRALKQVLGQAFFRYPKPVSLLRGLLSQVTSGDDLVVDAFAGSGTIAQAVLEANAEDRGVRRFLCVQRAEPAGDGPYETIADVARDRIRRLLEATGTEGVATFRLCDPQDPARDLPLERALSAGTRLAPC
jgi:adenine-specific DNA-methyltransferase